MGGPLASSAVTVGTDWLLILVSVEARATDDLGTLETVHDILQKIVIDFCDISKESLCGIVTLKCSTTATYKYSRAEGGVVVGELP